uniref:Immunoglobulin V-set domain-containing protein n=1 Tax=Gasterosteus aculeatus TaxID=69293 RepID=G3P8F6_GASAC
MICSILVIFILTSCVCAGSFVVNVTQSWYHAEENHNISLEWMFPTSTDPSPNALHVSCEMVADEIPSLMFNLYKGVEVPEMQDKRFAGRVQWDKDVLREGRLRLHISRLQTNDSGLYWCEVLTSYGMNYKECHLNVTAVKDRPEPETTSDTRLRRIGLYCGLGLTAALLVPLFHRCNAKKTSDQQKKRYIRNTIQVIDPLRFCTETV